MHEFYFGHGLWLLAWIALILVPIVNLVVLYVAAFSRWPELPEQGKR